MNDQKKTKLGVKIPQNLASKYEKLAKETGKSVNELVQEALAQYIGIKDKPPLNSANLEESKSELTLLKHRVTEIELYKTQIRDLSFRLSVLEQGMSKMQTQMISSHQLSAPVLDVKNSPEDEDTEDEPDEVLTDFLPHQ